MRACDLVGMRDIWAVWEIGATRRRREESYKSRGSQCEMKGFSFQDQCVGFFKTIYVVSDFR